MVEDALVEKLVERIRTLKAKIDKRKEEDERDLKFNLFMEWFWGNLLFFGLLRIAAWIVMGIMGDGQGIPEWEILLLFAIYWILIFQGLYRCICDLMAILHDDIVNMVISIREYIHETNEARKEYLAKKKTEEESNFSTMTDEEKKKFLETGEEEEE